MTKLNLLVILLTVLVSALAQLCLKIGAAIINDDKITGLNLDTILYVLGVLFHPALFLGLCMYALSAVSWIWVLSRVDLSVAYPFVSLSFLLTLLFGVLIFNEPLTTMKVVGTSLIILGCVILTRT